MFNTKHNRRKFLQKSGGLIASASLALSSRAWSKAPALVTADKQRPQQEFGLQFGDVTCNQGVVWSRCDRPSRMWVEYSYHENFRQSIKLRGPYALPATDYTARIDLQNLLPDRQVFVRVSFVNLDSKGTASTGLEGHFTTAPSTASRDIHFLWGGDTAGQGWGINPDFGGMKIYESMRRETPDFFIHSGDTIYADSPIAESVLAEDGLVWRNLVTPEVAKVAESLDEFRGRYKYNMMDHNVRSFNAEVPQVWQWDDHEVVNNWSDSKDLSEDERYTEKNVALLTARGATAFLEYAPMRPFSAKESGRVYRKMSYGPLMDLFVVDMRSYRGPNSANQQTQASAATRFLGEEQLNWLKRSLRSSGATWKVIAADMPIGLVVRGDGPEKFENLANGDGEPKGRELEMADLLRYIKRENINNVVWLTADVHYCAAHYYSPENAVFEDFSPFWEFVAGPLNAGSFGPSQLDNTFGPEVVFQKTPPVANMSPRAGWQFYGDVRIVQESQAMEVSLKDIDGKKVFSKTLPAKPLSTKP